MPKPVQSHTPLVSVDLTEPRRLVLPFELLARHGIVAGDRLVVERSDDGECTLATVRIVDGVPELHLDDVLFDGAPRRATVRRARCA
jgi:hypothetical protein